MGNLDFNASETPAKNMDFDPVPDGKYLAQVSASSVKMTSSGNGRYLACTFDLLDGFEGKKVFHNFNIQNPSEKAEQIGKGMLSSLCKACNLDFVDDSSELHEIPLVIKVKIEPGSDGYDAKNVITGFYKRDSAGKQAVVKQAQEEKVAQGMEKDIPF